MSTGSAALPGTLFLLSPVRGRRGRAPGRGRGRRGAKGSRRGEACPVPAGTACREAVVAPLGDRVAGARRPRSPAPRPRAPVPATAAGDWPASAGRDDAMPCTRRNAGRRGHRDRGTHTAWAVGSAARWPPAPPVGDTPARPRPPWAASPITVSSPSPQRGHHVAPPRGGQRGREGGLFYLRHPEFDRSHMGTRPRAGGPARLRSYRYYECGTVLCLPAPAAVTARIRS